METVNKIEKAKEKKTIFDKLNLTNVITMFFIILFGAIGIASLLSLGEGTTIKAIEGGKQGIIQMEAKSFSDTYLVGIIFISLMSVGLLTNVIVGIIKLSLIKKVENDKKAYIIKAIINVFAGLILVSGFLSLTEINKKILTTKRAGLKTLIPIMAMSIVIGVSTGVAYKVPHSEYTMGISNIKRIMNSKVLRINSVNNMVDIDLDVLESMGKDYDFEMIWKDEKGNTSSSYTTSELIANITQGQITVPSKKEWTDGKLTKQQEVTIWFKTTKQYIYFNSSLNEKIHNLLRGIYGIDNKTKLVINFNNSKELKIVAGHIDIANKNTKLVLDKNIKNKLDQKFI